MHIFGSYAETPQSTHEQMGKLLKLYLASKKQNEKGHLLTEKDRKRLKPIYRCKIDPEKSKVCPQVNSICRQ